jgi:hypothetical protein
MSALSNNDFSIFENIIENKYQKFLTLYWLLRDYSDFISGLKYEEASNDILKIEVTLSNIDIDKVMVVLQENITGDILICNSKKKIRIEVTRDE